MSFLDSIVNTVSDAANTVIGTAESVAGVGEWAAEGLASGTVDFFEGLPGAMADGFEVFKDVGTSLVDDAIHDVTHPFDFVSDAAKAVGGTAADVASGVASGTVDFVKGIPDDVTTAYDTLNWMAFGLPDKAVDAVTHPADTVSNVWDTATGWL